MNRGDWKWGIAAIPCLALFAIAIIAERPWGDILASTLLLLWVSQRYFWGAKS